MVDQEANAVEWYRKYRPQTLKDVVGQDEVVQVLKAKIKSNQVPHAILLSGCSGCGKTTIARNLKGLLDCADMDFMEINCPATESPIQTTKDIQKAIGLAPMGGAARIWYFDELHSWTRARYAMECLLKMLEDTPSHVYFIMATTNITKIIPAILTRSTVFKLAPIKSEDLISIAREVLEKEEIEMSDTVLEMLAENVGGSARKMLVELQRISCLPTDTERMEAIQSKDTEHQAIEICRLLLKERVAWKEIVLVLKDLTDEPESIRHMILGYMTKVLLGGGRQSQRARDIIHAFECNFYDGGMAALTGACWDIVNC